MLAPQLAAQGACKATRGVRLAVHETVDKLTVLQHERHLRVPIAIERPVVDVGTPQNRNAVVYNEYLGMYIDLKERKELKWKKYINQVLYLFGDVAFAKGFGSAKGSKAKVVGENNVRKLGGKTGKKTVRTAVDGAILKHGDEARSRVVEETTLRVDGHDDDNAEGCAAHNSLAHPLEDRQRNTIGWTFFHFAIRVGGSRHKVLVLNVNKVVGLHVKAQCE